MTATLRYSSTAEADYRLCQRRWFWRHVERWQPVQTPEALAFGTAWHVLREHGELPVHLTPADAWQAEHLVALDTGYRRAWPEPLDVIAAEQRFELPLIPDVLLVGRIDKLIRYAGGVWIVEHKTSGSDIAPESDYWPKLSLDAQLSTYWLGARALGLCIDGVLYDVARKVDLRPLKATPLEAQKRTKEGKLYANQRLHDETPADFGARCAASIAENPNRHYQRRELARTERQLAEHWLAMQTYARQMSTVASQCDAPQNPDGCMRWGRCEFLSACMSGQHPVDFPGDLFCRPPAQEKAIDNSLPF